MAYGSLSVTKSLKAEFIPSEFYRNWRPQPSSGSEAPETYQTPRSRFSLTEDRMEDIRGTGVVNCEPCHSKSTLTGFLPEGEASSSTESPSRAFTALQIEERLAVEALLKLQDTERQFDESETLRHVSTIRATSAPERLAAVPISNKAAVAASRQRTKSLRVVINSCKQSKRLVKKRSASSSSNLSSVQSGCVLSKKTSKVKKRSSVNCKVQKSRIEKWTFFVGHRPIRKVRNLNKVVSSFVTKTTVS